MKIIKLLTIASLVFAVSSCCACRKGKSGLSINATEWRLTQLYGESIESNNYRVIFADDGKLSGVGDCNRFAGTYTKNIKQLQIADNLVSTRMMCLNQAREDKFLGMLRSVDSFDIDGTRLLLIKDGDVLAIFDPVIPAPVPAK